MFSKILVPTVDVVRSTWLLSTTLGAGRPCLFVGESGTAKSATIQHYLNVWLADNNLVLNMNFSSRTSSADVQRAIEVDILRIHGRSMQTNTADAQAWHCLLWNTAPTACNCAVCVTILNSSPSRSDTVWPMNTGWDREAHEGYVWAAHGEEAHGLP